MSTHYFKSSMSEPSNWGSPNAVFEQSRWTSLPILNMFRRKVLRQQVKALESVASQVWEIAPETTQVEPRAYYLPNQMERVTNCGFASDDWHQRMEGGLVKTHSPTRGFLLKDAWLLDGVVYKERACAYLQPRKKTMPLLNADIEIAQAALYATASGIKYFGQWLIDDCVTYSLAQAYGAPVTTDKKMSNHGLAYEQCFGMQPYRLQSAYFKELVIFDDVGQNKNKRERFSALGAKMLAGIEVKPHPGVYILRGRSGVLRQLKNEIEIAEHLRDTRGFRILDPMQEDLATIIRTCAGAETIVGVEGSHIIHGMLLLPKGGSVLIIQPPDRFGTVIKDLSDRDGQHFGFVVGMPSGDGFTSSIEEIERTLDMMPKLAQST
ncbi:MAG: glycosyltransferase family 61 protein [Methylophilus sp.]|nr:glycosyltransferase family 61 protein [Methylophilus sp.]